MLGVNIAFDILTLQQKVTMRQIQAAECWLDNVPSKQLWRLNQ